MVRKPRDGDEGGALAIGLVAELTGLSEHTLRVWERRYGFPVPARSDTGARLYSRDELQRLSIVAQASRLGFRPRDVIHRPAAEIADLIGATAPARTPGSPNADDGSDVLQAVLADHPAGVSTALRRAAVTMGARAFVTDLVQPLLARIGRLWEQGKLDIRHEHLVSEYVSTQLRILLAAYEDQGRGPRAVLCTLPGEEHVIGLPMVGLYLAAQGVRAVLLGPNTPAPDVVAAAVGLDAQIVGLSTTYPPDSAALENEIRSIRASLPKSVSVWVGGGAAASLSLPRGVTRVVSWVDLDHGVERARAGVRSAEAQ